MERRGCCCLFAVGCQLGQQTARDVSPKYLADKSQASQVADSPVEKVRAESSESLASARALEQQGKLKQAAASYQKLVRNESHGASGPAPVGGDPRPLRGL